MKLKRTLLIAAIAALFFSCSRSEPQIIYGSIELVYYPGKDRPEERYSFFILPEDDDGPENLSELYLYHDREGLRWLITSTDWIQYEEAGKTWIGSRSIAMIDDSPLPRGQYRAVLVNKGGESSERRFTFDAPEVPVYQFPLVTVAEGMYYIDSQYPANHFLCYDQQGNHVQTVTANRTEGLVRDLRLISGVRTIALWAEDEVRHVSALTEAVATR